MSTLTFLLDKSQGLSNNSPSPFWEKPFTFLGKALDLFSKSSLSFRKKLLTFQNVFRLQVLQNYPSISLNSNQRIVFSSIKSLSSGSRLDFSVNSFTERVPLHRAISISDFSCSN